ncbi:MAG: hypothetical protein HGB04_06530 [Chlorobiaceae bacterium]|nr:hypothetical protein [Chlorobiaceae bacterium]
MVKGIEFEFANGERYVIPPLSLGAIEVLKDELDLFTNDLSMGNVRTVIKATGMALRRNYPEVTDERVGMELVDLGNMGEVMQAVMDVGGLRRKKLEEDAKGEPGPVEE